MVLRNPVRNPNGRFGLKSETPPPTMYKEEKYTIEKDVPLYDWRQPCEKSKVMAQLEVGDSVLFNDTTVQNLRGLASRHHGKKFAFRKMADGFRIWRTK